MPARKTQTNHGHTSAVFISDCSSSQRQTQRPMKVGTYSTDRGHSVSPLLPPVSSVPPRRPRVFCSCRESAKQRHLRSAVVKDTDRQTDRSPGDSRSGTTKLQEDVAEEPDACAIQCPGQSEDFLPNQHNFGVRFSFRMTAKLMSTDNSNQCKKTFEQELLLRPEFTIR